MKRRIISALLLIVMLISLLPAQAFAQETTADVSNTEMTVGGDSSFGGLLGNTVSEEQKKQSGSGEFECRITELTVEGTTAVVEYSVNTPATVVVAIYSDDGFTMLGSGTASAAADNTWVAVDIEISKMPKFFTAGAFMLDPETNNPISEEYKTTRYTKAYMDIKAATVADFDPELVINLDDSMTTNFAVFNENTIFFDYTSDAVVTDYGNGTYLIENAGKDLLDMQPGDKFAYTNADGTVLIVCAAYVEVNGTSVSVTEQADADLSDVFDFVKIEVDSFDKKVTYDDSALPEGVEMVDPDEIDAGTMGLGDRAIVDKKKEKSASIGYKLNKTFYEEGSVEEGSVSVKLTGELKFSYTSSLEVFISLNYQNVTFSYEQEMSGSVSVTGKFERKFPFAKIKIRFLPGISADIVPRVAFKFSASIDWTVQLKNSIKYMYDSDTGTTYSKSGPTLKSEVAVKGEVFVGLNIDISINVISKKILSGGIELEGGAEISMKETIDPISSKDTGRIHECSVCFEGEVDGVFSLTAYLDILKSRKAELTLSETKSKISDCYRSFDFGEFGFTKCPHVSYKVSVQLLKDGKAVSVCVPVELYHDGQLVDSVYVLDDDLKPVISAPLTDSAFYLPNGKYKVIVELDGERQEKEFTVKNGEKQLKLVFPDDASDYQFTISESSLQLSKGDTKTLTASFNGKKVASSTIWSSSNAKVAEVKNGVVTAKNNGDAVISASYSTGGLTYSASCKVKVSKIDAIASGKCGENLTWTLDDTGTLTISGTGAMYDGSDAWLNYRDRITNLVIGNGVTTIGNYTFVSCNNMTSVTIGNGVTTIGDDAFNDCTKLTSITIPDSVTTIGDWAFHGCTGLTSVTIGGGVTSIGESAFSGCKALTSVTIPDSVTIIGKAAFHGCTGLTSVTIGGGVTSIGDSAFYDCENLTSVTIPDSVTNIGDSAFMDCTGLASVTIGNGVTTIGSYTFARCTGLTSVTIGSGVTTIGSHAFNGCKGLTSVTIPDSVTTIGNYAFHGCTGLTSVTIGGGVTTMGKAAFATCTSLADLTISGGVTTIGESAFSVCQALTSVTIPDSVTIIGNSAFNNCIGLTSVTIPDSVTTIGNDAFYYCTGLTSVTIGGSVTTIGEKAFWQCSSLTSVTIPDSVTTIGDLAFRFCSSLIDVYYAGTEAQWNAISIGIDNTALTGATIHFGTPTPTPTVIASGVCGANLTWTLDDTGTLTISGTGRMNNYSSGYRPWDAYKDKKTKVVINTDVTTIGNYAFYDCTNITSLTIPDSVTTIGEWAFSGCTSLASVTIGSGVTTIGIYAFSGCTALTSVTIPDSVTTIGIEAFSRCTGLTNVEIGNGVTSIDFHAFSDCTALTSITIPSGVTSIDSGIFSYCSSLVDIDVDSANENYTSIDGVVFSKDGTTLIAYPAGRNGAYEIPNIVTTIDAFAFEGCTGLTSVTIPDSVTTIGNYAFSSCAGLTSVTIPDSVTTIGYCVFNICTALRSVTIPSSVTTIEDSVFYNCTSLTSVTIPNSVNTIGNYAFSGCSSLTTVYYTGTEEQWNAITIGSDNAPLTDATIHFESSAVTALAKSEDEEEDEIPTEDEEPLPEIEIEPETEPEPEPEPEEEESPDALIVDAPDAAPAAELELAAAHKGTSGTKGKFRTAKFTNLEPGEEYVLIVSVDPSALLKPANLLYIAQDNAAADGTLTLSYIPRTETPSAAVTLYGVPHERYITLDREYAAMQVGESAVLSAEVTPAEWSKYLTWSAENPTGREIISVSGSGSVTALDIGTAYAVATVSYKDYTFTARCRVDVTEKSVEEEIEISGIELGTTAVTSELYSRNYAEAEILLLLPQNMSVMSADAAEKPEDNGIAIKSARFTDPAAAEMFDLAVVDDRRVAVVPKNSSIENAKAVKSSYTSAVAVTVGNTEFVTDAKLRLTVKKTMPKLKADAVQFNSFYSGQSAPIVINGASVTAVRPDTGKKLAVPAWLTLSDDGKLSLTPDAPKKSASGSAYILVDTEEWAVPAAVTVSVKNIYKAPKLKLSAASVTMSSVSSRGVEMKLMPTAKNETLEQYNVTGLTAYDGYTVENFDAETGAFTLKAPEGYKSGKTTLAVSFGDTDTTVSLPLTVKTAAPAIRLKKTSVTLNPAHSDIAEIDMTLTPADYTGVLNVSVTNASGTAVAELDTWLADGKLYVHTVDATKYNATYKVSVSVPGTIGRPAVLTVRTSKENMKPSVTVRAAGAIDLTYPDSAVTITPAFRNFNGGFTVTGGRVTETKGRTAISEGDLDTYFTVTQTGNTIRLEKAENAYLTAGNTYTAKLTLSIAGMELTASAKITVKATAVNLRLSKSALTLNKLVNDASSVAVTCTTKNYVLGEPVISVMDKTGKNSADGKLDVSYSGGKLYVAVNGATEYGASYKVLISAGEGYKAAALTVTIPAQAKSAITGTLKVKGSIDIIRSGSGITLTPTYKNVSSAGYTERVEVYSSADKFARPVEGVFAVDGMKLTNICADSRVKYKVRVIASFASGAEAATPLTAITVKTGVARLTVSGKPALYLKDVNSRGDFRITSADLTLNGIAKAEIKDAKNAAMFELYEYGGGRFAIGFKDGVIAPSAAKLRSVSIPINIWLDGNETAKPNTTVTVKINIAK